MAPESGPAPGSECTSPAGQCEEAIVLAVKFLEGAGHAVSQYVLVSAHCPLSAGLSTWQLTFKPRTLVPQSSDAEIGAGGELFLEVDIINRSARLLGHGE